MSAFFHSREIKGWEDFVVRFLRENSNEQTGAGGPGVGLCPIRSRCDSQQQHQEWCHLPIVGFQGWVRCRLPLSSFLMQYRKNLPDVSDSYKTV